MKKFRLVAQLLMIVMFLSLALLACQNTSSREPIDTSSAMAGGRETFRDAPNFEVTTITGESLSLKSLRGKTVLVNFWASWCPPCVKELPHLNDFYKKYKDKGLVVVGLNVENNKSSQEIKVWVDKMGLEFPVAIAGPKILHDYGVSPIPHSFFIDRKGQIKAEVKGYADGFEKNMESKLLQLLKG